MEQLILEILTQCQNVQCGAKLAAEFHFIKESDGIILKIVNTISLFKELKTLFLPAVIFHNDDMDNEESSMISCYIYRYDGVDKLINEIEAIQDKDSILYHFAMGKLFGYNDYEVMKFINKLEKS
jgi:hypothetical protein